MTDEPAPNTYIIKWIENKAKWVFYEDLKLSLSIDILCEIASLYRHNSMPIHSHVITKEMMSRAFLDGQSVK